MPAFGLIERLKAALLPSGIRLRGTVAFAEGEGPALEDGDHARSVVLLGNVGGSIWPAFAAWRKTYQGSDPLDRWSKSVIGPVAAELEATALYPSDPPYMPFQQWAIRAEGLTASPLGILIHPIYGLWHGYRGALAFRQVIAVASAAPDASPCKGCVDKPCLNACPADAVSPAGFSLEPCRTHLSGIEVQARCMETGCLARNACPVGADFRYPPEQLRFHMDALAR